jgi:hypothetical protein
VHWSPSIVSTADRGIRVAARVRRVNVGSSFAIIKRKACAFSSDEPNPLLVSATAAFATDERRTAATFGAPRDSRFYPVLRRQDLD